MWRIHRRLRTSYLFAHFYKWNLGDGQKCVWCWLCRRFPIVRKVIPYSWDYTEK